MGRLTSWYGPMPRSLRAAVQPRGFAPPNGLNDRSRAILHSRCWSVFVVCSWSVDMLSAIWRLAPTHHSKVYWATKSARWARFIENASECRSGARRRLGGGLLRRHRVRGTAGRRRGRTGWQGVGRWPTGLSQRSDQGMSPRWSLQASGSRPRQPAYTPPPPRRERRGARGRRGGACARRCSWRCPEYAPELPKGASTPSSAEVGKPHVPADHRPRPKREEVARSRWETMARRVSPRNRFHDRTLRFP